ncbi:MAG: hypothetical protein DBY05_12400 [Clostridiales bacterium]|jgi:hypothetical protein|nr:MAG: hypothetical protein DBY05_12400 [Clostridiales bacterium]
MIKNSNTVYERQNQPEMQALIVAQHFAYTSAKRWVLSLFFILVIIPLGINVALFFNLSDTIIGILSFLSIILLFVGEIVKSHIENTKAKAAHLQQKFDLFVFDMNSNIGIDENIIAEAMEKYSKKDWYRKKNWYQNYENISELETVFYCQKENIDWTGNLAKRYCYFLLSIISLIFISFFINLIVNKSSILKLLSILVSAIPLLSYGLSSYKKIKHDNKELIELDRLAKEINSNIAVMSERELQNKIYILQTMIYQFRKTKYLIPDWFECKFYPFLQALEKRTADMRKNRNR